MTTTRRVTIARLMAMGATALGAVATSHGQTLATQRLRYGGDRRFPPFESLDSAGKPQGFQPELLKMLGEVGRFEVEIELRDWPEIEQGLKDGRFDAIAMVDTPERRAWAAFTRSHATPSLALYLLIDRAEPQSIGALAGWRVADVDSAPMRATRQLLQATEGIAFTRWPDWPAALRAVAAGQADAALMPRAYGDALLDRPEFKSLKRAALALNVQAYAFAVRPTDTALRERLDAALAVLEGDGRLEALGSRWLSSHAQIAAAGALQTEVARKRNWLIGGGAMGAGAIAALAVLARRRAVRVRAETSRREASEALLVQAQARLEHAFMRHPDSMLVVSLQGGLVVDANHALCTLLNLPRDAIVAHRLDALPVLADGENLKALAALVDRDGGFDAVPLQVRRHGDADLRHCMVSCERMPTHDGEHLFALVRDVTEQLRADAELRAGYDALRRRVAELDLAVLRAHAERDRAQASAASFTVAVAKEMKSDAQSMRGLSGLVQRDLSEGRVDAAQRSAALIDRSALRMERAISALSRLAGVDQQPLKLAEVDMRAYAGTALSSVAGAHAPRQVQVQIDALPSATADPALVLRLWRDLIDNAFKFSAGRTEARVRVDSHTEAGRRWYRVTDNGVGFEADRAHRLFQPFQSLHGGGQFEGMGVGLALAQRIMVRHGGEIRLRSQTGVGTVVEFSFDPSTAQA